MGKTSLVAAVAAASGHKLHRINLSEQVSRLAGEGRVLALAKGPPVQGSTL